MILLPSLKVRQLILMVSLMVDIPKFPPCYSINLTTMIIPTLSNQLVPLMLQSILPMIIPMLINLIVVMTMEVILVSVLVSILLYDQ